MTIPVSSIVSVSISAGSTFPSRAGFGTLLIVTTESSVLTTSIRTKLYADIDEVEVDWASTTEAYKSASSYFSQNPRPTKLKIGYRDSTETITEALNAIQNYDSDWYGLSFTKEIRDLTEINSGDAVLEAGAWCEARTKVFFNTSNSEDCYDSASTTDIMYLLEALGYKRTISIYSSTTTEYPCSSLAGRAFTTNFEGENTVITLKFKQLPGITVENLTSSQFTAITAKKGNTYISVGGLSIFSESYMASGVFLDEVHGLDWLENAIQTQVFGFLATRTTKVPYTDIGTSLIEQQVIKVLDQGVRNGLLAPGVNDAGEFLSRGYSTSLIAVADVSDSDKESSVYNGVSFTALGAGAIHGTQINGIYER